MSSDEEQPAAPRTRAEARAAREAAERAVEPSAAKSHASWVAEPVEAPEVAERPSTSSAPQEAPNSASQDGASAAAEPEHGPPPAQRRFLLTLTAVLGILFLIGGVFTAVSLLQGPRLTQATVDPAEAIEVSSAVTFTANQALAEVDPGQVSIEPAVPFTVSVDGRSVSIHLAVPLDDRTDYAVQVRDVTAADGGPATTFSESFTTPAAEIFLLRRSAGELDTIFRTDLTGENAVPVFQHERINDFRATTTELIVAVEEGDRSQVLAMRRDGSVTRQLELPGDGYVGELQASDQGDLIGYTYSDRELTEDDGRASVLVTQPLDGSAEPQVVKVDGEETSVFEWRFVPDSAAVLFINFDGGLTLIDPTGASEPQDFGLAATIQGVTAETAIVERGDGSTVSLNLADGVEQPLPATEPDYGAADTISPFPGGTLRHVVARAEDGMPLGQAVITVDDDGEATPLIEVDGADAILQACASPSGQYAAVVVAPDLASNSYDDMLLPLPENLETHLIDIRTGEEIVALTGFDVSWCNTAPRF